MAKRVKFPLKAKDGYGIRTIEELREHLGTEELLQYFFNGKLGNWLEDRYYAKMANKVRELDRNDRFLYSKLCAALGVEEKETDSREVERIILRQSIKSKMKDYTPEEQETAVSLYKMLKGTSFHIRIMDNTIKTLLRYEWLPEIGNTYIERI